MSVTFFIVLPTPFLSCLLVDTSQGRWYQDRSNLSDRSCPSTKGVISFLAVTLFYVFSSQLKVAGQKCSLSIKVPLYKNCKAQTVFQCKAQNLCRQLYPLSALQLGGCPQGKPLNPPISKISQGNTHVYTLISKSTMMQCYDEARHSEQLFSECLPAALQPPKEWKRRICPKKLSKSSQSKILCGNFEQ